MDIISYGVASKAAKEHNQTKETLGQGVEGAHPHTKGRIDQLEEGIQGVVKQADDLIVKNSINIMKAHAQLNAIAKTKKYNMHNMLFDDLLDLSGIDTEKSSGYTHDALEGSITADGVCVIETEEEIIQISPQKAILSMETNSQELHNLIPVMTSATSPSGRATASSTWGYSYNAWRAFDHEDNDNCWISSSRDNTGWLQYEFDSPQVIGSYRILPRNEANDSRGLEAAPKDWIFEAWDGNQWIILDKQENIENWERSVYKTFTFENTNAYTTYRINVLAIGNPARSVQIGELEMYSFKPKFLISRDKGVTWETITPNSIFYFNDSISPQDNKLKIKAELASGTKLFNYALTWA